MNMKCDSRVSFFAHTFGRPCFGREPKARVTTLIKNTKQPACNLKTKWGVVKLDIAKFVGCYNFVLALYEYGTTLKDVLSKAWNFTNSTPKNCFIFIFALLAFVTWRCLNG